MTYQENKFKYMNIKFSQIKTRAMVNSDTVSGLSSYCCCTLISTALVSSVPISMILVYKIHIAS